MVQAPQPVSFLDDTAGVRGLLHRPAESCGCGFVLTHGAGSDCKTALLSAVADTFCESGFTVLRCDLPFRQQRPHGSPLGAAVQARDREGLRKAVLALRNVVSGPVLLGGHSYGGRQSTILAAEDPTVADGLMLLSYPLHPAKRPEQARTAHFPSLKTPALFVHGARDAMGSVDEMHAAIGLAPGPVRLVVVEAAGHDLSRLIQQKGADSLPHLVEHVGQLVPGMDHHQPRVRVQSSEVAR